MINCLSNNYVLTLIYTTNKDHEKNKIPISLKIKENRDILKFLEPIFPNK